MTEHDMLLIVQRQMNAIIAERDALREQVRGLVEERDGLRAELSAAWIERNRWRRAYSGESNMGS